MSDDVPLNKTRHYLAGVRITPQSREEGIGDSPDTIATFYARLGIAVVPTICDVDCGLDVMKSAVELSTPHATTQRAGRLPY